MTGEFAPVQKIVAHRQRMGLSKKECAAVIGVTVLTVSNWEQVASVPGQGRIVRGLGWTEAVYPEPKVWLKNQPEGPTKGGRCIPRLISILLEG